VQEVQGEDKMNNLRRNKRGGHINFIVSLVLIALFTIAIIIFAVNFASDNDSKISIASDPEFANINNEVSGNLTTFYKDIGKAVNSTYESTISTQTDASEGGTGFKVGPGTALLMATSTISLAFSKIFGSGSGFGILLTALVSVLAFISIMYIMKAWAGKNPD